MFTDFADTKYWYGSMDTGVVQKAWNEHRFDWSKEFEAGILTPLPLEITATERLDKKPIEKLSFKK